MIGHKSKLGAVGVAHRPQTPRLLHGMIAGVLVVGLVVHGAGAAARSTGRLNVIVINVDNHEKGELGYYGNRFIETPNVDRLFREGLRFENYRIAGRCTSSRSALMTGRYHARNGAMGTGGAWGDTRENLTTLGHLFSQNGYRTALFGKWHMGDTYPLRPEDRGFQEVVTIHNGSTLGHVAVEPGYNGSSRTAAAYRFRHNGKWEVYEGFRTDTWFSQLKRYLTDTREHAKPFFVYLATVTAHGPHFGPKDLRDKYRRKYASDEWSDLQKRFSAKAAEDSKQQSFPYDHAADIEGLDRNVGRLTETLAALKLSDNTVVIYMSDGAGGGAASVSSRDWPEEARRSGTPFVIRMPKSRGKTQAARAELVANIDILPTLAEICGISLTPALRKEIDGQSFASLIGVAGAEPWRPRAYVSDHQSSAGKDDLSPETRRMMLFRPLASSRVHLPDGQEMAWRSQKPATRNAPADLVKKAKAAYDNWLQRILKDLPLGAFASVGDFDGPVYLDAYPIPDGPAGAGVKGYFLLDVAADGLYEIDTNTSGRDGGPAEAKTKTDPAVLSLSVKIKPGELPIGFDAKLNGYRVLPATLKEYFETTTRDVSLPATMPLKKGRYLLSAELKAGKPIASLRVRKKPARQAACMVRVETVPPPVPCSHDNKLPSRPF